VPDNHPARQAKCNEPPLSNSCFPVELQPPEKPRFLSASSNFFYAAVYSATGSTQQIVLDWSAGSFPASSALLASARILGSSNNYTLRLECPSGAVFLNGTNPAERPGGPLVPSANGTGAVCQNETARFYITLSQQLIQLNDQIILTAANGTSYSATVSMRKRDGWEDSARLEK
jgi:hypothetical protein